ncbi:hypothetical protein BLNAU_23548 [Blattamonas nauphoetae]|uniref:Uncharacterized protein n=1 Tax=Blattamonas nauphoetae TaxID=2049346 RepID=A0ABQ9WPX9_9EUKA|nr:hypothetical protein BLNAU_23548 [Blattamonas nauphoetae]
MIDHWVFSTQVPITYRVRTCRGKLLHNAHPRIHIGEWVCGAGQAAVDDGALQPVWCDKNGGSERGGRDGDAAERDRHGKPRSVVHRAVGCCYAHRNKLSFLHSDCVLVVDLVRIEHNCRVSLCCQQKRQGLVKAEERKAEGKERRLLCDLIWLCRWKRQSR